MTVPPPSPPLHGLRQQVRSRDPVGGNKRGLTTCSVVQSTVKGRCHEIRKTALGFFYTSSSLFAAETVRHFFELFYSIKPDNEYVYNNDYLFKGNCTNDSIILTGPKILRDMFKKKEEE